MPLLFFALASASSEQTSHEACTSIALHPGSNGWLSARCCTYPQELLLQLERPAEVHEVEISARGDLVPRSIEVHLSKEDSHHGSHYGTGDQSFQHVCTLEMPSTSGSTTARSKRAKGKMFALCSGHVKLIVHEPLVAGPSNPYKQVSLASVDIWGHEDALPRKPRLTFDLGEQHDEISAVLMELGVPLSLIPVDEDSSRLVTSDLATKALVKELRDKEEDLLRMQKFGEAQQLEENVQQLYGIGRELNEFLRSKEDALKERPRNLIEIERLSQRISELEEKRLHVAALYDTDWWLTAMSLAVEPIETTESSLKQQNRSSVAGSTHSTHHSHPSHPSHSSGHSENASAHSTQRPPAAASLSPASPKSARNSMPRNFGRDQTQIPEALSTARSQP